MSFLIVASLIKYGKYSQVDECKFHISITDSTTLF
jgi:hypothetical protein